MKITNTAEICFQFLPGDDWTWQLCNRINRVSNGLNPATIAPVWINTGAGVAVEINE